MKKRNILGALGASALAALCFVACGPSISDQIVGSYKYEAQWNEPETEQAFARDISFEEMDTFGEDKAYTEEGTKAVTYYINEDGRELSAKLYFNYVRTGTWKIEYEDGKEWLVINGLTNETTFDKYELSEDDPILEAWAKQMGEDIANDEKEDDSWASEHNFIFVDVNENTLTYETKSETINLTRIK